MSRLYFQNARLLDPASGMDEIGGLLVEDERIVDLGAHLDDAPGDAEIIDCEGLCLAPGLIDMRARLGEPGHEHMETIDTLSASAAKGGITALVGLPNTDPPIDDAAVVEFVARRAREVKGVKIYVYGAATRGFDGKRLTEVGLLRKAGALAFTDGDKAIADSLMMRRVLSYASGFDALVIQHNEEPSLTDGAVATEGEIATRLGLPAGPAIAEAMMLERDLRLVELTGARYHAAHLSTEAAVDELASAKRKGLEVSADTAPVYFALNEMELLAYRTFAKVSPPLRAEADRVAIVEALKEGVIDVIASDHWGQDQEAKRLPFAQADPGVVGVETMLQLALELYHRGDIDILDLLAKMTINPARLLDLPSGVLTPGAPADLMLFDLDRPTQINVDALLSKSKNSPFDGRPVQGMVMATLVDGRFVYDGRDS
ncbi:MAG: dihydroorotase [Alphaproteobacteria bacterium]